MKKTAILLLLCFWVLNITGLSAQAKPEGVVPVKNVIFLIGDGMGLAQVNAAMLQNDQPLNIERARYVGLQKTYSASNKVTDSAAAGTALATGTKTNNGAIGVDPDGVPQSSILEEAASKGMATGLVVTVRMTHATPAAFIAHVDNRGQEEEIATWFLKNDIDVFIGGGRDQFEKRTDGRNLSEELREEGYRVVYDMDELSSVHSGKVSGLMHANHLPRIAKGRDPEFLLKATSKALEILSQNGNGFFMMIEGSQIDLAGHSRNIRQVVSETLDFDRAVGAAFDFADHHPGTLVVVTADHETGGLTIPAKDPGVRYKFSTGRHTGVMVPVYAYGTGAENFTGIMENTDIPERIRELLEL